MEKGNYKAAIITSILVVFACLGLARFAFGMVLPNMKLDLGLNNTQIGWIGSLNFIGYLSGLFFTNKLYNKLGPYILIKRSLLTQAFFMGLMALSLSYSITSIAYFFTGLCGAFANIAIMTYIAASVPKQIKGKATGMAIVGAGLGIMLSGIIVPFFDGIYAESSWKVSWGIFALFIFFISFILKYGIDINAHNKLHQGEVTLPKNIFLNKSFLEVALLYLIFGITYVVFVTFFVITAQSKWGVSSDISGVFWIVVGFSSIFAGPLFGSIADKIGNFKALMIIYFIQTFANLILAYDSPEYFLWICAFMFGISTWGIPSIMAVLSSELFGAKHTAKILSFITLFFGVGQILGPIGAGWIIDSFENFSYPFYLSATLTFLGFLGALTLSYQKK